MHQSRLFLVPTVGSLVTSRAVSGPSPPLLARASSLRRRQLSRFRPRRSSKRNDAKVWFRCMSPFCRGARGPLWFVATIRRLNAVAIPRAPHPFPRHVPRIISLILYPLPSLRAGYQERVLSPTGIHSVRDQPMLPRPRPCRAPMQPYSTAGSTAKWTRTSPAHRVSVGA